jgi:maltokinase
MTNGTLGRLLAAWLPAQRWFAGAGTAVGSVTITSDTMLADGDPALRHLIVAVTRDAGHPASAGEPVSYQVLAGLRSRLPEALRPAVIGVTGGRTAYDALADPQLAAELLRGIVAQRTAGPIRFAATPGAAIDQTAAARMLPPEQSNTSIVFGDQAILKVLRRPHLGSHPDLEVPAALARNGSALVSEPLGWIECSARGTAEPMILAILSRYFAGSTDGWSLAVASMNQPEADFTDDARLLGLATATLHAELAEAFGTATLPNQALRDMADSMTAALNQAVRQVPELRPFQRAIRARYAELGRGSWRVTTQRIHGDYHLAQVLRTAGGWVVLDFEGEPSVPLTLRRAYAPALRDVAGMLRSFDYAARHQLHHNPDDQRLAAVALDWSKRCSDAFCDGYGQAGGGDPRDNDPLLRALILGKAVYEAVYEAGHRPSWLPIPLAAIAEGTR